MKRKHIKILLVLLMVFIPFIVYAGAMVTTYGETVTKANNYIMTFRDRRKYLLFNKNYVYERNGFGDSSQFTMGGLLSKSEFDLSVYNNQSYLANGKEYWTLTNDGSNKYYIDAFVQSKNPSSVSGTRVTEYIKPGAIYSGRGTYSNPWVFDEGYAVDVISNNTDFGTVSPLGEQYVRPGDTLNYDLEQANGYYYNGSKDECGFVKSSSNKYESKYKIENIRKDITCTAVYELRTYKFDLLLDPASKDFDGNAKTYTTNPSPNPIYYKYRTNWYSNSNTSTVIHSITPPTMTGWTFKGYYYGNTKVIDADGTIIVTDLNLGTRNDFVDTDHILYATDEKTSPIGNGFERNAYTIKYALNNGAFPAGAKQPTSAKYDEIVEIDYPLRAGYSFEGWSHNGSATAKAKNISTDVTEDFVPNSTKTKAKKFANLTPVKNGEVTMTANWKECPAGTYNDGTSINCTPCPAGKFSVGTKNTSCTACAKGSYAAGTGNSTCTVCGKGKTTASTGTTASTSCTNCTAITGLSTWADVSWSNNTVTGLCLVGSCIEHYRNDTTTCTYLCNNPQQSTTGCTAWSDWTSCSKACGTGTQSHTRTCPNRSDIDTNHVCSTWTDSGSQNCNTQGCCSSTYNSSSCGNWGSCSKKCGGGTKSRTCKKKSNYDDSDCGNWTDSANCNTGACTSADCCPNGGTLIGDYCYEGNLGFTQTYCREHSSSSGCYWEGNACYASRYSKDCD